jgi:D-amino-acid dehydrogenase
MSTGRVVIIGGGVIGTACAHYLIKDGYDVTVIDSGRTGGGCSHANCGYVSPSHVLPLTEPGAALKAFKSLFKKNAPFRIKPRFDPELWGWLIKFARRCNTRDMLQAAQARHALLASAKKLYVELFESEDVTCEWQQRGLCFVFKTAAGFEKYGKTDELIRENFGVAATRFDATEMVAHEPALLDDVAGGWLYECDAHLRPDRLLSSWRMLVESRGVKFIEQCKFKQFVQRGGQADAIATTIDELSADFFVVATGAWTPQLNSELGCRIPIQPGKGYSITMPRPQNCPEIPLIFPEHKVAVTPMQSGYRLGSTMEFAGYDTTLNRTRLEMLKQSATHYLHQPYCDPVEEEWYGWRPMTYDGVPYIDRSPRFSNVFIAAGHNMLGLSMATATGKLTAELISEHEPHIDPSLYRIDRK